MKIETLKNSKDFRLIREKAKKFYTNSFILLYSPKFETANANNVFGFIITKKVGPAVVRNKIKRRIKYLISNNQDKLLSGYNFVFIVKRGADLSFKSISRDFFYSLSKIQNNI